MAERLAGGNVAIALLANAIATGAALYALIVTFSPHSGAEFNPVVTMALVFHGLAPQRTGSCRTCWRSSRAPSRVSGWRT